MPPKNPVVPGRMTANLDGEFVVFLIGMRINKSWKVHKWWPVFVAMPRMIRRLSKEDLGMLGYHLAFGPGGPILVQYWRSAEQLQRFARDSLQPHLAAWRMFNRRSASPEMSVSGMRHTSCGRASTRRCTGTCHGLDWRSPVSTCRWEAKASPRPTGCALPPTLPPSRTWLAAGQVAGHRNRENGYRPGSGHGEGGAHRLVLRLVHSRRWVGRRCCIAPRDGRPSRGAHTIASPGGWWSRMVAAARRNPVVGRHVSAGWSTCPAR
jgi:hypothetical protein